MIGGVILAEQELYTTVRCEASDEFEEKRSIFIGHAKHIECEEDALEFIKKKKKEYYDARHNVYAYVLSKAPVMRYSDDGEPQGTGGVPVLETINKSGVTDVCVVVTRYFGGILLGAGGLVRAYSHGAALALRAAEIVTYRKHFVYELDCSYPNYQKYLFEMSRAGVKEENTEFGEFVTLRFSVLCENAEAFLKRIVEIGNGKEIPKKIDERFN